MLDQLDKPITAGHTDFSTKNQEEKHSKRGPKTLSFAPISFVSLQELNIYPLAQNYIAH